MATKFHEETGGCTFQWKIENISHCWLKMGERIDSPTFIADALDGTKWFLRLYPSGVTIRNEIGFYLQRELDCVGPESIRVTYQLVFLDKDGNFLKERIETKYVCKGCSNGSPTCETREKVFVTQREAFLPNDTLTLQCTIWNTNEKPTKTTHLYVRTIFQVNRKNFAWRIDKFSSLGLIPINIVKDDLIEFYLALNVLRFEKKLVINVCLFKETLQYFSFQVFAVDSEGRKENLGCHECFAGDIKRGKLWTLLFTEKLLENKTRILPNDVLTLYCEYVCSDEVILYEGNGVISPDEVFAIRKEHDINRQEELDPTVLTDDFKLMYNDAIFSDTKIRTLTKTFSAHKAILGARSPVFRSMFNNDMKEKNTGYVDITDFEDDTIHLMLLYMYTDSLEDLDSERAPKLYMAADKYQIASLKIRCTSFLKANLSPNNACAVLVLADQHQDIEFKCFAENYILENYKEVLCSEEWKGFMDTHLKLAAYVMYKFSQYKINAI